ncbi:Tetratricopeptide-like helical domain containing protein [Trema orientale]|uniref:Tetratricopeptide-like helical domain containing protein n=1 Tax=Trema orientale TaxID=63057 RepID=A0A2P5DWH9_TREOI|nr:Tetratricopeptide-like helical domain containing protein [Trema orientale]
MPRRNLISWNAMMAGYLQNDKVEEAYENLNVDGFVEVGDLDSAWKFFKKIPEPNVVSWNAMLAAYVQDSQIDRAVRPFSEMTKRDSVSWTTMINGYLCVGKLDEARQLLHRIPYKNVAAQIAIISGYMQSKRMDEASQIFNQIGTCDVLHHLILKSGYVNDLFVSNALITMYAKSGSVFNAELVFRDIGNVDIVSWNSLIASYALNGYGKEAVELLDEMLIEEVAPNQSSLVGCSRLLFKSRTQIHKIEPLPEHYACMVDLLGWAERSEEALKMVLEMKVKATAGLSGTLLRAAKIHRNIELGKYTTEKLLELEPHKASNYVLLSNIHAEAGKWNEVERIRVLMSERITEKQPGCSWIELGNQVHSFLFDDAAQPRIAEVCSGPIRLRSVSEMGAYVFNQNLKNTQLGKSGRIEGAIKVFSEVTQKNIVTYNSMISAYAKNGEIRDVEEAYEVYVKIPKTDLFSWTLMMSYYTRNGELQNARELFNLLPDKQDSVCWNAMIVGYAMNGLYEEAKKFFYEMPVKNLVSWNSMLAGYTKNGEMRIGLLFFKEMARRDVVSWNLIVDGFIEVGDLDYAWKFFKEIPESNVVSWVTILCEFARNGRIVEAHDLFE